MTANKAWAGALLSAVGAAIAAATQALDDGTIVGKEWLGVLAALVAGIAAGLGVYQTRNEVKTPL